MNAPNPIRLILNRWRSRKYLREGENCLPAAVLRQNWVAHQMQRGSAATPFQAKIGDYDWLAPTYDEFEYLFARNFLQPVRFPRFARARPFIIDVGAHAGFVSLYLKLWQPTAHLLCFEPAAQCFQLLEQNIERNRIDGVKLVRAACGRNEGETTLFVAKDQSLANSTHKQWDAVPVTEKVKVVRLSDYIDGPVDLLKVNAEGAEWEIMDDLIGTGKLRQVDHLLVAYHHRMTSPEVRFGQFLRYFEENGYVYEITTPFSPQNVYGDKWQSLDIYARRKP